jgi:hypothetical protein
MHRPLPVTAPPVNLEATALPVNPEATALLANPHLVTGNPRRAVVTALRNNRNTAARSLRAAVTALRSNRNTAAHLPVVATVLPVAAVTALPVVSRPRKISTAWAVAHRWYPWAAVVVVDAVRSARSETRS